MNSTGGPPLGMNSREDQIPVATGNQQQAMLFYNQLAPPPQTLTRPQSLGALSNAAQPSSLGLESQFMQHPSQGRSAAVNQQQAQHLANRPGAGVGNTPSVTVGIPQVPMAGSGQPGGAIGNMVPPNFGLLPQDSSYSMPRMAANGQQAASTEQAALQNQQQQLMMSLMQGTTPATSSPGAPASAWSAVFPSATSLSHAASGQRLEQGVASKQVTPLAIRTSGLSTVSDDEPPHMKRSAHIAAEQKRRNNIKVGFQDLQAMLPSYKVKGPAQKLSKSAILFQALDHVTHLQQQCRDLNAEVSKLQSESVSLKAINMKFQQAVSMQQSAMGVSSYDGNIQENPDQAKFLLFKTFVEKLYQTFEDTVQLEGLDGLQTSVHQWLDNYVQSEKLQQLALEAVSEVSMKIFHDQGPP